MNQEAIIQSLRERKSKHIQRSASDKLFSVRQVCELVQASIPEGIEPDKKLSMVCCFEGVFLKDCLFVHYERDHDNVARAAMRRGAYAIMCSHQIDDYPCVIVKDVLGALNLLLRPIAARVHIPTTVVTGSVGKTTVKNFVNCVYSSFARTFCNITNGNTFEYVGFELQRFDRKAKFFVQEVNESDSHNTLNASQVLQPEIAIITNMDKSHIGELGSEEAIMQAICEITAGMDENGTVILNADDPNSSKVSFRQKTIRVAIQDQTADCIAKNLVSDAEHIEFDLNYQGEQAHLRVPITGTHNAYNAMMAYVAGRISGIPIETIKKGLLKYRPLGFRQNMYRSSGNLIYADCYNASARSIRSALETLEKMKRKPGARKIAVLGDIAEIDGFQEDTYRDVANSVSASDVDILITFGTETKMIHEYLSREIAAYHCSAFSELIAHVKSIRQKNDIFLFKASRSMHLEKAIQKVFPSAYRRGMTPVYLAYGKWTLKTL